MIAVTSSERVPKTFMQEMVHQNNWVIIDCYAKELIYPLAVFKVPQWDFAGQKDL